MLSRATTTIANNINDKRFKATTAVLVTYVNVTDADRTVSFLLLHNLLSLIIDHTLTFKFEI